LLEPLNARRVPEPGDLLLARPGREFALEQHILSRRLPGRVLGLFAGVAARALLGEDLPPQAQLRSVPVTHVPRAALGVRQAIRSDEREIVDERLRIGK